MGPRLGVSFIILAMVALVLPMVFMAWTAPSRSLSDDSPHVHLPLDLDQLAKELTPTSVLDARGYAVPIADYQRIASCSTIADALLPDLVSTQRLVACTNWYAGNSRNGFRVGHLTRIHNVKDTERILTTKPDLVLLSSFSGADYAPIERLREQGITVFDLGNMHGMSTLLPNIRRLAAVLGVADRGKILAQSLERRMARVANAIPTDQRRKGIYLNVYDTQLSGGTIGASYHDVLTAAGLIDVAVDFVADRTDEGRSWPRYRSEDILLMDPDVIVTTTGKADALRAVAGLGQLRALITPGGTVEMPVGLLNTAGPDMLLAAETLHALLYKEDLATPPTSNEHIFDEQADE